MLRSVLIFLAFFYSFQSFALDPKAFDLETVVKNAASAKLNLFQDKLLEPEQAFEFSATVQSSNTIYVNWKIAPNYYLYREKIKLELVNSSGAKLGDYLIPNGLPKEDEVFGKVEIFYEGLNFTVPILRESSAPQTVTLRANFQGCAERGVCYPPMTKDIVLNLPVAQQLLPEKMLSSEISEQDSIADKLKNQHVAITLLSFLGFGLLLSFTPCVFPMIPILSGMIIHDKQNNTKRAFFISSVYVIASALTYTLFGILAALFGQNLQALFQEPAIIISFSGLFIALALSMFGFYELDLPSSIKTKLHHSSVQNQNGSYYGAAMMGALSSLIMSPCVAAPLAGALIYIGQTGNVFLGGSALFMLGLGMGIPLILIGTSAGKFLPKAGNWLYAIKNVFGVLMIGMAIWLLTRILPASVSLFLWGSWLIIPAIYLNALNNSAEFNKQQLFFKGIGIILLFYGLLLLVGASMGNSNPFQPLQGLSTNNINTKTAGLVFERINSINALETKLTQAANQNQSVMLDVYADWCISCKEMEMYTFSDNLVKQALKNVVLLQIDVTENSENDKAFLKKFGLIGAPAILFFQNQQELKTKRVIGYQTAEQFLERVL